MVVFRRIILNKLAVIGVLMAVSAPVLAFSTPSWSNATTDTASTTDFDTGTLLFPAQAASQISIVGSGIGYTHDHTQGGNPTVEVLRNGVWTLVFTGPVSNGIDTLLSSFPVPLANFPSGQISGVRLAHPPVQIGNAYHSIDPTMTFSLTGGVAAVAATIPTLSEYAVLALILGVMLAGLLAIRRRRTPR
jgi:hypothetical protein